MFVRSLHKRIGDGQAVTLPVIGLEAEQETGLLADQGKAGIKRGRLRGDNRLHGGKEGRVVVGAAHLLTELLGCAKLNNMGVANPSGVEVSGKSPLIKVGLPALRALADIDHMADPMGEQQFKEALKGGTLVASSKENDWLIRGHIGCTTSQLCAMLLHTIHCRRG
jgi:hypothetical protein